MDSVRAAVFAESPAVDGAGVTVAVLDTGIDTGHPDLQDALDLDGSRSFSLRADLVDRHGHGTHICGIIAGSGFASDGKYRGIAPGVRLLVFKIMESQHGTDAGIPPAIEAALELGADIINYSGGRRGPHPAPWKWPSRLALRDHAFRAASEEGVLCLTAAGNDGWWDGRAVPGSVTRPGNLASVIAVGSTMGRGHLAPSSARGPVYIDPQLLSDQVHRVTPEVEEGVEEAPYKKPDLVCPGERERTHPDLAVGIISTRAKEGISVHPLNPSDHRDLYGRSSGTSQATAVASGLAALGFCYARQVGLELGSNPGLAMRRMLCKSTMRLDRGDHRDFGHGILLWPHLKTTIQDCSRDEQKRLAILGEGPTLWNS